MNSQTLSQASPPWTENGRKCYNKRCMSNTITVPTSFIDTVLKKLDHLEKTVARLASALEEKEPPYGSDAWWEWSNKKGLQEIREGKGLVLRDKKEIDAFFDTL